jgi:hypothetical protein
MERTEAEQVVSSLRKIDVSVDVLEKLTSSLNGWGTGKND